MHVVWRVHVCGKNPKQRRRLFPTASTDCTNKNGLYCEHGTSASPRRILSCHGTVLQYDKRAERSFAGIKLSGLQDPLAVGRYQPPCVEVRVRIRHTSMHCYIIMIYEFHTASCTEFQCLQYHHATMRSRCSSSRNPRSTQVQRQAHHDKHAVEFQASHPNLHRSQGSQNAQTHIFREPITRARAGARANQPQKTGGF